jgi:hypothetical protein
MAFFRARGERGGRRDGEDGEDGELNEFAGSEDGGVAHLYQIFAA